MNLNFSKSLQKAFDIRWEDLPPENLEAYWVRYIEEGIKVDLRADPETADLYLKTLIQAATNLQKN